jgi:Peptidase S46
MYTSRAIPAVLILAAALAPASADEGMWTLNNFPADRVEKAYGFRPDQRWLDHVRLSSLRLARGCSAAFVSPQGLVQTNHHCARACIRQLSTSARDLGANGFYARELKDEVKCPDVEVNQLVDISDVTERMNKATAGKDGAAFAEARRAAQAVIARECSAGDDNTRCDVVSLYRGGIYNLYKYRRYQDVRLVFAPEEAVAFFGGDPDNFEFPRYDFDVTYMRVYRDGNPLDSRANYLRYAAADAKAGDLAFTSGHPGSTHRLDTVASLEFRRDVTLPRTLFMLSELRGILTEFSTKGPEQARIAKDSLFGVENRLKASKGQFAALVDPAIIRSRAAAEQALRAKVEADPALRAEYGAVWDNIRAAQDRFRLIRERYVFVEDGGGFRSQLFGHAKNLVRYAAESGKPDEARLREFTNANFPAVRQSILSTAPIYPELEKLTLTFSLTKLREALGPDDPIVKKVLGRKSPAQLAAELVDGSALANVDLRRRLLEGGAAAIAASNDPMIVLARAIDPDARAVRKDNDDNVDAPLAKASGQIATLMFKLYGTSTYPDATFTLRISYGAVAGYQQDGKTIEPISVIDGVFERATGEDPFKLPDRWLAAQSRLNPRQPFNMVTSNDIIGGNSGSPLINKAGEVIGLIFDGNRQSLGGGFGYDGTVNRAISVNVGALREALSKVYGADRIVDELAK